MGRSFSVGILILSVAAGLLIKTLSTFEGGPHHGIRPISKEAVPVYLTSEMNWLVRMISYIAPLIVPIATMTACPTVVEWEKEKEAEAAMLCMKPARDAVADAPGFVDLSLFDEETIFVARPVSSDPLEVKLFQKRDSPKDTKAPLIVYLHGGGFTVRGSPLTLAARLFAKLLDVDGENSRFMESATWATVYYRLAPENTYPAATEDSLLALNHLVREMGLGRGGIHVVGISAGGTLAMEMTMKSLDLVDTFFVDEPPVPLPTSDEKWSMDSPSFRRYSYSRQVPTTWLEWSLKAYTGLDTVHDIEKDLRLGTIATGVDITGGSMNVSEWVKRSSSASLPKLILVTAKGDPLRDGGLAFKDVYEQVIQAAEAKNSSMSGGVPRIKHFETSSGHVGFYLFEPEVFKNIVTEWYFGIHGAWERKNSISIDS